MEKIIQLGEETNLNFVKASVLKYLATLNNSDKLEGAKERISNSLLSSSSFFYDHGSANQTFSLIYFVYRDLISRPEETAIPSYLEQSLEKLNKVLLRFSIATLDDKAKVYCKEIVKLANLINFILVSNSQARSIPKISIPDRVSNKVYEFNLENYQRSPSETALARIFARLGGESLQGYSVIFIDKITRELISEFKGFVPDLILQNNSTGALVNIEYDGPGHNFSPYIPSDQRDAFFTSLGIKVVRIDNRRREEDLNKLIAEQRILDQITS